MVVQASLAETRSHVALSAGHFIACREGGTRIQVAVDDLRWMARVLAGSGLSFAIECPPELGEAIRDYAAELVSQVERGAPGPQVA